MKIESLSNQELLFINTTIKPTLLSLSMEPQKDLMTWYNQYKDIKKLKEVSSCGFKEIFF